MAKLPSVLDRFACKLFGHDLWWRKAEPGEVRACARCRERFRLIYAGANLAWHPHVDYAGRRADGGGSGG